MYRIVLFQFLLFLSCLAHAENNYLDFDKYYTEKPSLERAAIIKNLTDQFNPFSPEDFSQNNLNKLWLDLEIRKQLQLCRIQIIDNKIYADADRILNKYFKAYINYLNKINQKYHLNNIDFLFFGSDTLEGTMYLKKQFQLDLVKATPTFMFSKNIKNFYEKDKLLIPDPYMIAENWHVIASKILAENYSWSDKIEKFFWRGALSEPKELKLLNLPDLTRANVILLTLLYPNYFDTKISVMPFQEKNAEIQEFTKIIRIIHDNKFDFVSPAEHLKFKYLLSLDGHTAAWQRLPWILLSNSLLIKQDSSFVQWFYPALVPFKHYVPIKQDLSNWYDLIKWLKANDSEIQKIVNNAQEFALTNLLPEEIEKQTVMILNEYAKKQALVEPELKVSLPKAEEIYSSKNLWFLLFKVILNKIKYLFS